jgi:hypothetical protein
VHPGHLEFCLQAEPIGLRFEIELADRERPFKAEVQLILPIEQFLSLV